MGGGQSFRAAKLLRVNTESEPYGKLRVLVNSPDAAVVSRGGGNGGTSLDFLLHFSANPDLVSEKDC